MLLRSCARLTREYRDGDERVPQSATDGEDLTRCDRSRFASFHEERWLSGMRKACRGDDD